jgi:hypothetical protein
MPKRTLQNNLNRSLNERRGTESDVKYRHYVRPLGNGGMHVVKDTIDGVQYTVSGPTRTFRPGAIVPTGSHTGNQGEFIIEGGPRSSGVPEQYRKVKVFDPSGD